MNSEQNSERRRQLDRLVDGELPAGEYHVLLQQLDREPSGWRECAMAFLEAQALQQEFCSLQDNMSERIVARQLDIERSIDDSQATRLARVALAIAATIAIAFASGAWWQSGQPTKQDFVAPEFANNAHVMPRPSHADVRQPIDRDLPHRQGVPTEHLTFVVDRANGQSDRFELPVYEANDRVARELLQDRSPMPEDVERELRNSGFNVRSQRKWTPVRLRDGRRAFFPVDQLDITPVSRSTYQ